ncbi:hypothetical protein, conserved in T.vivax [Trypanosoma vivax Y486]|uniref:Uncharacterized protein n=1 Tax=Trypanosoma vivax (strain Y486) TaxID=1055687 RepID=F9WMZ0_TRYVY|nr:hypothetical protein, conserved in T.vivax [Trypanosoma vivax Y486]|eukprot:CCD18903.1 hypothetical protein, conserved in T.vivax [Trypanosoma vivax Y486]
MTAARLWLITASLSFVCCANAAPICRTKHAPRTEATDEQKCAGKNMLLGWLNVANKTALRAEAVQRNVTDIRQRASELRSSAQASLDEVRNVMEQTTGYASYAATVKRAMKEIHDAIEQTNKLEVDANSAEKVAESSVANAFSASSIISVAASSISGLKYDGSTTFEATRLKLDKITVRDNSCPTNFTRSAALVGQAEKLSNHDNLTEWKEETLRLLQEASDELQSNERACHWTFNDKLENLMLTVQSAAEQLDTAVGSFNRIRMAVCGAEAAIKKAAVDIRTVNETILNSFKKNGADLCSMVGKYATLLERLKSSQEHLVGLRQRARDAAQKANKAVLDMTETKMLVQRMVGNISSLPSSAHHFTVTSVADAQRCVAGAEADARLAIQKSTEVDAGVQLSERHLEHVHVKLEYAKGGLIKQLKDAGLSGSYLTFEGCNKSYAELLRGPWVDTLRHAKGLNATEMSKVEEALNFAEAKSTEIGSDLAGVGAVVDAALGKVGSANQLEDAAVASATKAVAEALRQMMDELCGVAAELRMLKGKAVLLDVRSTSLKTNISVEAAHAAAVWKSASGALEAKQYVEEGFTFAGRWATVANKLLQRVEAQHGRVVTEMTTAELGGGDVKKTKVYNSANEFVQKIFTTAHEHTMTNVCDGKQVAAFAESLKSTAGRSLLENAGIVAELSRFVSGVDGRMTSIRTLLQRVAISVDETEAALAVAIRRAHDQPCAPLYKQLLGVLRLDW